MANTFGKMLHPNIIPLPEIDSVHLAFKKTLKCKEILLTLFNPVSKT